MIGKRQFLEFHFSLYMGMVYAVFRVFRHLWELIGVDGEQDQSKD